VDGLSGSHAALGHDPSPDQRRTRQLADGLAPIIARTVALSRLPVGRRLAADVFTLADQLTTPTTDRNDS
jgi:hypothetical protein